MPYLMEVIGPDGHSQGFLSAVDFETNAPNYPTGSAECTANPLAAIVFSSAWECWVFITTPSKGCPLRPDGGVNRPLRAFNIQIVEQADAKKAEA